MKANKIFQQNTAQFNQLKSLWCWWWDGLGSAAGGEMWSRSARGALSEIISGAVPSVLIILSFNRTVGGRNLGEAQNLTRQEADERESFLVS